MIWILLLIILFGLIWYSKVYKVSVEQHNLTKSYLVMLMLTCKTKEDFEKLLWRMYSYDSDNIGMNEFNAKWEALCSASGVSIIKKDYVSPDVVEIIAENIYNDPINKRYIQHIVSSYPDSISLMELKKRQASE